MPTIVALLRGVNAGRSNRIAMPDLRVWLTDAGFDDVRTHVQSGNVVLSTAGTAESAADAIARAIRDASGLEIPVIVRTAEQMTAVVAADPHGAVADDPKRSFVVFCAKPPPAAALAAIEGNEGDGERFAAIGRELYTWCPGGMQNSRVMRLLTDRKLGVTVTVRNWNTVLRLHEMASDDG